MVVVVVLGMNTWAITSECAVVFLGMVVLMMASVGKRALLRARSFFCALRTAKRVTRLNEILSQVCEGAGRDVKLAE